MAAKSVTITDYRTQIPGVLAENRLAWYFPHVNSVTSLGAKTSWRIVVRLVAAAHAVDAVSVPYADHDKFAHWVPIADEYFKSGPMPGIVAWTDVESMQVGGKRRATIPTITAHGLNAGKANATNPLTQALRDALGQYNKQIKKAVTTAAASASTVRYPPMLATPWCDHPGPLDYASGIYVQPKFDGVRAVAVFDMTASTDALGANVPGVVFYSRTKLLYPGFGYIKRELFSALDDLHRNGMRVNLQQTELIRAHVADTDGAQNVEDAPAGASSGNPNAHKEPTTAHNELNVAPKESAAAPTHFDIAPGQFIYLDGEIYKHGVALQDISGYARRENCEGDAATARAIDYMVYDAFVPALPHLKYAERKALLDQFFSDFGPFEHVLPVPTVRVGDPTAITAEYQRHLAAGYEGAMVRTNEPYRYSNGGYHCRQLLKLKPVHDAEFRIVGYELGRRGKAARALMFVCETAEGKRFNVTPAMELSARNELAAKMAEVVDKAQDGTPVTFFDREYRNRMLIVKFDEWSKDKLPQRARTEGVLRTWE